MSKIQWAQSLQSIGWVYGFWGTSNNCVDFHFCKLAKIFTPTTSTMSFAWYDSWSGGNALAHKKCANIMLDLKDKGYNQGSKGIRQWPINWCTFPMMIHKTTLSIDYN